MLIRAAVVACALTALAGCAGQATYRIRPYQVPGSGDLICCEALVTSSRDVAQVTVHATKTPDGGYTLDLTETGISASAPIQAQNGAVSAVAGAVSNTAAAAVKFIP